MHRGGRCVGGLLHALTAEAPVHDLLPPDPLSKFAGKMLGAVATVAEMAARGFGLEPDAFTARMRHAPHLLAPTGKCLPNSRSMLAFRCAIILPAWAWKRWHAHRRLVLLPAAL